MEKSGEVSSGEIGRGEPPPTSSNSLISRSRLLLLLSVLLRTKRDRVPVESLPIPEDARHPRSIPPPAGEESSSKMPAGRSSTMGEGVGEQNLPLS